MPLQHKYFAVFLALYSCCSTAVSSAADKPPNIVFILTDDQDVVLGGLVSHVYSGSVKDIYFLLPIGIF